MTRSSLPSPFKSTNTDLGCRGTASFGSVIGGEGGKADNGGVDSDVICVH